MSRLSPLALAILVVAALTPTAWSQQTQTGQLPAVPGVVPSAPRQTLPQFPNAAAQPATPTPFGPAPATPFGGTSATPFGGGSATPLSPGQSFAPSVNAAGQVVRPGQVSFTPVTPGGRIRANQPTNFNNGFNNGFVNNGFVFGAFPVSRNPWFADFAARQQLALNDVQFNQLNAAYLDAWTRYNDAVNALPANLTEAARARRMDSLQRAFDQQFDEGLNTVLVDPRARARFNQLRTRLGTPFQGVNRVNNLTLQQPSSLSPQQEQQLRLMGHQWNQLWEQAQQRTAADPATANQSLEELRLQAQQQIAAVLTPQQMQAWPQLVAPYYDFPPDDGAQPPADRDRSGVPPPINQTPVPSNALEIVPQSALPVPPPSDDSVDTDTGAAAPREANPGAPD